MTVSGYLPAIFTLVALSGSLKEHVVSTIDHVHDASVTIGWQAVYFWSGVHFVQEDAIFSVLSVVSYHAVVSIVIFCRVVIAYGTTHQKMHMEIYGITLGVLWLLRMMVFSRAFFDKNVATLSTTDTLLLGTFVDVCIQFSTSMWAKNSTIESNDVVSHSQNVRNFVYFCNRTRADLCVFIAASMYLAISFLANEEQLRYVLFLKIVWGKNCSNGDDACKLEMVTSLKGVPPLRNTVMQSALQQVLLPYFLVLVVSAVVGMCYTHHSRPLLYFDTNRYTVPSDSTFDSPAMQKDHPHFASYIMTIQISSSMVISVIGAYLFFFQRHMQSFVFAIMCIGNILVHLGVMHMDNSTPVIQEIVPAAALQHVTGPDMLLQGVLLFLTCYVIPYLATLTHNHEFCICVMVQCMFYCGGKKRREQFMQLIRDTRDVFCVFGMQTWNFCNAFGIACYNTSKAKINSTMTKIGDCCKYAMTKIRRQPAAHAPGGKTALHAGDTQRGHAAGRDRAGRPRCDRKPDRGAAGHGQRPALRRLRGPHSAERLRADRKDLQPHGGPVRPSAHQGLQPRARAERQRLLVRQPEARGARQGAEQQRADHTDRDRRHPGEAEEALWVLLSRLLRGTERWLVPTWYISQTASLTGAHREPPVDLWPGVLPQRYQGLRGNRSFFQYLTPRAKHALLHGRDDGKDIPSLNAVALYMNHVHIWRSIRPGEVVVVFEEDSTVTSGAFEHLQQLDRIRRNMGRDGWLWGDGYYLSLYTDFLRQYSCMSVSDDSIRDGLHVTQEIHDYIEDTSCALWFGTSAYIIGFRAARYLLDGAHPIDMQVDAYVGLKAMFQPDAASSPAYIQFGRTRQNLYSQSVLSQYFNKNKVQNWDFVEFMNKKYILLAILHAAVIFFILGFTLGRYGAARLCTETRRLASRYRCI
eukprot:477387-Hanusia_phi.AAC.1